VIDDAEKVVGESCRLRRRRRCDKMWAARRRWRIVTPDFPKKTKCKAICMPGSSFMHIVTYK
jgi:hypothetical protein